MIGVAYCLSTVQYDVGQSKVLRQQSGYSYRLRILKALHTLI